MQRPPRNHPHVRLIEQVRRRLARARAAERASAGWMLGLLLAAALWLVGGGWSSLLVLPIAVLGSLLTSRRIGAVEAADRLDQFHDTHQLFGTAVRVTEGEAADWLATQADARAQSLRARDIAASSRGRAWWGSVLTATAAVAVCALAVAWNNQPRADGAGHGDRFARRGELLGLPINGRATAQQLETASSVSAPSAGDTGGRAALANPVADAQRGRLPSSSVFGEEVAGRAGSAAVGTGSAPGLEGADRPPAANGLERLNFKLSVVVPSAEPLKWLGQTTTRYSGIGSALVPQLPVAQPHAAASALIAAAGQIGPTARTVETMGAAVGSAAEVEDRPRLPPAVPGSTEVTERGRTNERPSVRDRQTPAGYRKLVRRYFDGSP